MLISLDGTLPCDKDIKFRAWLSGDMSEEMFMFAVTAGVFAFLMAIVFGARSKRYSSGYTSSGGHTEANG
jgi:hypothetical protein